MSGPAHAAQILARGGLVAFPTETVYGLGADASNAQAMARLYAVKGRPANHPVIVHFECAEQAFSWAHKVPSVARELAARFWPGPLTMLLTRAEHVGDFVTGGQASVGLRVPSHPVAQQLLKAFSELKPGDTGAGIAAPSANRFGRVSPTTAEHVHADLGSDVDMVLQGGPSEIGIESTIVDLGGEQVVILRPGNIDTTQIEAVLGGSVGSGGSHGPRHSGGLERHYAPVTPARLLGTDRLAHALRNPGLQLGAMTFSEFGGPGIQSVRMPAEPEAYARTLYAALRELDAGGCDEILIEAPPDQQAWAAVRDRLLRACTWVE